MQVDSEVLSVLSRATTNGTALTLVGQLDNRDYPRMTERMTLSEYRQHVGVSRSIK